MAYSLTALIWGLGWKHPNNEDILAHPCEKYVLERLQNGASTTEVVEGLLREYLVRGRRSASRRTACIVSKRGSIRRRNSWIVSTGRGSAIKYVSSTE